MPEPDDAPVAAPVDVVVDVVVVGAGISGLTAARELVLRGRTVHVLEAQDRVGGRTCSAEVAGATVDLGGTFVGPTQERILALADELGLARHRTHDTGDSVIRWRGRRRTFRGTIPPVGPAALLDLGRVRFALGRLAAQVPLGHPEATPRARALDQQTLGSWLHRRRASRATHDLLAIVTRVTWGCEPGELSLLHAAHYVHQAGGLDPLLDTAGGAQEEHFVAGSQGVSLALAAQLAERGAAVDLGRPVAGLEQHDGGVVAHTAAGPVHARLAVVAVPPALRGRIAHTPALPAGHRGLAQRWAPGVLSKAYAVYDRPFWREAGLSGEGLSDLGPAFVTFDASPADGSRGVLLGFIGGRYAAGESGWDALPPAERRLRALASFADLFGPEALDPVGYVDQRWAGEQWLGGGPVAAPGPGAVVDLHRHLTEPVGRVHWAGTETSDRWAGFMDGAVRAGERAAREVLARTTGAAW